MMAELAPQWGKFANPSGQVWPKDLSWPSTIQSNFCKNQENFKALTQHMNYPSGYFGIEFNQ